MSLRWRLPLVTCALIVAVLAAAVWLANREVEATLVGAAGDRAQASADQIAGLLERSAQQGTDALRRAAGNPAVIRLFQTRDSADAEASRRALAALTVGGPRRIQLWHRDGSRLLDIPVPAPANGGMAAPELPAGTPPSAAGRSGLQTLNGIAFTDDVVEVRADVGGGSTLLGYIRVRSTTRENPPGIMRRILGGAADIKVGSAGGSVWTDFTRVTSAPRVDTTRRGVAEYRSDEGTRYVGALALVRGTRFVTWVEFDRAAIVAPARTFLRRMVSLSLVVVAVAFIVVATVSARLTRPLRELARAADAIAAGDLSPQVTTNRHDEIGRLAGAFNAMVSQVAANLGARQRAEETLRAREASFHALFSDNPLPMWVYDAETLQFLEVNDAATRHYGYTRNEFLAMTIADIRPAEDVPRLLTTIAGESDGYQVSGIWRHRLKSGQLIDVDIVSHTTLFEDRRASLVVVQDVTERQQLEERLRQSQKMDAIGQLAGGVAHDFNNLLTAITGYSSLLLEQVPADNPMRHEVDEIRKAAETAASLTRQLLAFSRRQILKPEILDLNAIVVRMHGLLDRLIGEDIDLDTRLVPALGKVNADPGQIEQIILNLSLNARDAMPTGGRLTLETANVVLDEAYAAQHVGSSPGPHVMLAVSDTGVGMDAETRARIFEPFFTTKRQGKGTGLGLATVYGIVKQSGGSIWVYSEPGHGATFKVYLPIATESAPAPATPPKPKTLGGSETILVAEDQAEVRNVVRTVLSRHGYTVLEAEDGDAALLLLREHASPIHLLLTDVVMPSMSGRELVAQLRASHPTIKILYTSGYTDDAIVRHGVLEPGVAFIQKPFTPTALLEKVREVLEAS